MTIGTDYKSVVSAINTADWKGTRFYMLVKPFICSGRFLFFKYGRSSASWHYFLEASFARPCIAVHSDTYFRYATDQGYQNNGHQISNHTYHSKSTGHKAVNLDAFPTILLILILLRITPGLGPLYVAVLLYFQ